MISPPCSCSTLARITPSQTTGPLDALRSTGSDGAEGACIVREVKLSLEHRSWLDRRVCIMDLSDASKRMGTQIDGFIGQDVLRTFSVVRIDYKAESVRFEE